MPSTTATLTVLAIMAGVGIGMLLYYWWNDDGPHDHRNSPQQSLPSSSLPSRSASPSRRSSPSRVCNSQQETPTTRPAAVTSTSRNGQPMSSSTITIDCGHIFDDRCYKIWLALTKEALENARLCPRCPSPQ